MTEHRDVAVEVTIAAPIETVWRALRDRDDLRRWHGWEADELDEEIELIYFSEAREEERDGPERRLVCGANVFELSTRGPSTVVRVVMTEPPESDAWHGWYEDIRHGWHTFVEQLRFFVERHRGRGPAHRAAVRGPARPGPAGAARAARPGPGRALPASRTRRACPPARTSPARSGSVRSSRPR